jgi:Adenylate and Guanylate cyclase catalytic domain
MSDLFYPIIDDTSRVNVLGVEGYKPDDHVAVGLIAAQYYWRTLIRDALPDDSHGIHVVFTTPCSNNFTYEIRGPDVGYLGVGDLHERAYDNMQESAKIHELGQYSSRQSHTTYSGAILGNEFCPMTLYLYPSDTMKSRFTTINPILFTVGTIVIFAFTSLVFHCYDAKVEDRQRNLLKKAVDSSAIVSSLFPSNVRGRLYPTATQEAKSGVGKSTAAVLQSLVKGPDASQALVPEAGTSQLGAPIAELYPDTTVLFADIAGFTASIVSFRLLVCHEIYLTSFFALLQAWSSVRSPTQVFFLLETVYGAFDTIAKQHGVFKVETIGDCYVAVVGLPKPNKQHAIVMAQFADDCRRKMNSLMVDLEETMGNVSQSKTEEL